MYCFLMKAIHDAPSPHTPRTALPRLPLFPIYPDCPSFHVPRMPDRVHIHRIDPFTAPPTGHPDPTHPRDLTCNTSSRSSGTQSLAKVTNLRMRHDPPHPRRCCPDPAVDFLSLNSNAPRRLSCVETT
uniref:Uncharacterized protein n=1 Tax=Eutreptiella gymnastica TaxID=73025 RepID=A0A7S4FQ70_9EUGL